MSYGLIFYKNFSRDGHNVRLEIHSREMEGDAGAREIGNFTELTIHMNESHAAIDEAIHKSTVTFSMVDAPDMPDTGTTRNSGWEFFYNSEPDEYSVSVYEDGALLWHGYVRQDAWEGDLVYRNTLTISCIDGLGRLNDVFYEPRFLAGQINNGMAKVKDIINAGMEAAKVAMYHYVTSLPHELVDGGQSMLNWAVDTSSFEGKTWGEIVEPLLNSLGLCIRYDGRGSIVLRTLRDLHTIQSAGSQTPQFLNRSGHFSLLAGYKAVKESTSFEASEAVVDTFKSEDFNGTSLVKDKWHGPDIRQYTYDNNFSDEQGGSEKYALVQMLPDDVTITGFNERTINLANRTKAAVSFNLAHNYDDSGAHNYDDSGAHRYLQQSGQMVCLFKWVNGSSVMYWDFTSNSWELSQRYSYINLEGDSMDFSFDITSPDSKGRLVFGFVLTYPSYEGTEYQDTFTRLGGFTIEVDEASFPKAINVTTNYNEANTLNLDRKSDYAQAPTWMLSAGSIGNAFYKYLPDDSFPPVSNMTAWDDKSTFLPFPVQVHMMLLALHAKPNYVLSGDLKALGGSVIRLDGSWSLYGRSFMLLAGNYNCLDGFLHDASLEEFDTWEDIFGSTSASYDYKESAYPASSLSGGTTVTSGGGGGGGEGGGITLAELQAYLTSNHYINSLSAADITAALGFAPANSNSVPTKTSQLINDNNMAYENDIPKKVSQLINDNQYVSTFYVENNYAKKSAIPTKMSQLTNDEGFIDEGDTRVAAWNDAADKRHTHENKGILDTITQAFMTAWNNVVAMAHTHSNKTALDRITEVDVNILSGIREDDPAKWNYIYDQGLTKAVADKLYQPLGSIPGGSGEVYIASYNKTTYSQVENVYREKAVLCNYNNVAIPMVKVDENDDFIFKGFFQGGIVTFTLTSSGWSIAAMDGESNIFVAEFGVTADNVIEQAYNAGKVIFCKFDGGYYPLTKVSSQGDFYFGGTKDARFVSITRTQAAWQSSTSNIRETATFNYMDDEYEDVLNAINEGFKVSVRNENRGLISEYQFSGYNPATKIITFIGVGANHQLKICTVDENSDWDIE